MPDPFDLWTFVYFLKLGRSIKTESQIAENKDGGQEALVFSTDVD